MTPSQMKKAVSAGKIAEDGLKGFSPVRYAYFGRTKGTNIHEGVTCVGYTISDDEKILKVAIAFCSPGDIFNKEKSHAAIHGRIAWGKTEDIEAPEGVSFIGMRYEEIVNVIKAQVDFVYADVITKGFDDVKSFVKAHNYKTFPSFAEVNLPWWFKGI